MPLTPCQCTGQHLSAGLPCFAEHLRTLHPAHLAACAQALPQGQIQFRAAKARAAIMNNYKPPPMAEPAKAATAARGLFGAPAAVGSGSGLFGTAGASSGRGLGQQQAVAAGPTDMEMD